MVCQLQTPQWLDSRSSGLKSAVENVVDGYVILTMFDAIATAPASDFYYTIYYSLSADDLFDAPKLIATSNPVSVPPALLTTSHYIAVRVAQLGISSQLDDLNLISAGPNLFIYPGDTQLGDPLGAADGYVVGVDSTGYPENDGYLLVGDEVILYSDIIQGYDISDGYDGFLVDQRDPFNCNDVTTHSDGYSISLFKGFEDSNIRNFRAVGSCALPIPTWPGGIGIKRVEDLGIGTSVNLSWNDAKVPSGFSSAYFNIYHTDNLNELLKYNTQPVAFSTDFEGILPNLTPGKAGYFAVKVSYQLESLDLSGITRLSSNVYAYPALTTVQEVDGYWTPEELGTLVVADTDGFPLTGYLQIGSEVMAYDNLTSSSFNVVERDVFTMGLSASYPNGTPISMFRGVQDTNRKFYKISPSWDAGAGVPRMPIPDGYNSIPADGYDGYSYNQDEDGYRSYLLDSLTEDHSDFEEENVDDDLVSGNCGYQRTNWDNLFSGNQCGTYSGGRRYQVLPGINNGAPVPIGGGINVWDHATRTEEDLLGKTGEYFILLRRKWSGKKCARLSMRSEHPHARCSSCFGTTFTGGYDRYVNVRPVRQGATNPNGFIMVRVDPYDDDLELNASEGLKQTNILNGWTISLPTIKDRDILIKYYFDISSGLFIEEFRYEVLKVNRNKLLFNQDGKQNLTIKRLDQTKEIYKFENPTPGSLPGIPIPPGI